MIFLLLIDNGIHVEVVFNLYHNKLNCSTNKALKTLGSIIGRMVIIKHEM